MWLYLGTVILKFSIVGLYVVYMGLVMFLYFYILSYCSSATYIIYIFGSVNMVVKLNILYLPMTNANCLVLWLRLIIIKP